MNMQNATAERKPIVKKHLQSNLKTLFQVDKNNEISRSIKHESGTTLAIGEMSANPGV
jgi:hypothetical protein